MPQKKAPTLYDQLFDIVKEIPEQELSNTEVIMARAADIKRMASQARKMPFYKDNIDHYHKKMRKLKIIFTEINERLVFIWRDMLNRVPGILVAEKVEQLIAINIIQLDDSLNEIRGDRKIILQP